MYMCTHVAYKCMEVKRHKNSGAAPHSFQVLWPEVGVVKGVVTLWRTNCYRYSVSIFILAIVQYSFTQTGLTVIHIQTSDQLLLKA